ncbi:MAG: hypothetical protein WD316_12925 [Phycisphaeraceae bacterium]
MLIADPAVGLTVSGRADAAFWNDVTNTSGLLRVAADSSATFFGDFAGAGIDGPGDVHLEADITPAQPPGSRASAASSTSARSHSSRWRLPASTEARSTMPSTSPARSTSPSSTGSSPPPAIPSGCLSSASWPASSPTSTCPRLPATSNGSFAGRPASP